MDENEKQQGTSAFTSHENKRFLRRMEKTFARREEKIIRLYLAIISTDFSKPVDTLRMNVVRILDSGFPPRASQKKMIWGPE